MTKPAKAMHYKMYPQNSGLLTKLYRIIETSYYLSFLRSQV